MPKTAVRCVRELSQMVVCQFCSHVPQKHQWVEDGQLCTVRDCKCTQDFKPAPRFPQLGEYVKSCLPCCGTGTLIPVRKCPSCDGTGSLVTEPSPHVEVHLAKEYLSYEQVEDIFKAHWGNVKAIRTAIWNAILEAVVQKEKQNNSLR